MWAVIFPYIPTSRLVEVGYLHGASAKDTPSFYPYRPETVYSGVVRTETLGHQFIREEKTRQTAENQKASCPVARVTSRLHRIVDPVHRTQEVGNYRLQGNKTRRFSRIHGILSGIDHRVFSVLSGISGLVRIVTIALKT